MNKSTLRKIMQNKRNDLTRKEIQLKVRNYSNSYIDSYIRFKLHHVPCKFGQEVFTHEFIIQALKEGKNYSPSDCRTRNYFS